MMVGILYWNITAQNQNFYKLCNNIHVNLGYPKILAPDTLRPPSQILNMKFEEYLMDMLDHLQMKACDTKLQK